jgi:Putative MetA-pathway of phenol degradation
MYLRRLLFMLLAGGAIGLAVCASAFADSDGAKTLFIWRDDSSTDGGPNLEAPLICDRPKFTQSPVTVGCSVVQLETGYTYMYDDENGVRVVRHSFPESLLRIGMFADWFELRADWDYDLQRTKTGGAVVRDAGLADLNLGCKLALTPQDCFLPESGLILESSVPAGDDPFSAHEVLPNINYCYDWDLTGTNSWILYGNTEIGDTVEQMTNETHTQVAQSLAFEHAWSDRIHSFVECYMFAPIDADTAHPKYYFDRGVTVLLTDNIQWDLRAGMGLNKWADDFFAGTGVSVRYW